MTRAWTKADTRALMLAKLEESAYPLTAFQLAYGPTSPVRR